MCERGCLTPAEVAAAVQAEREGCIDAMRAVPVKIIGDEGHPDMRVAMLIKDGIDALIAEAARSIRARGPAAALRARAAEDGECARR